MCFLFPTVITGEMLLVHETRNLYSIKLVI
jgi:hypothetical protein